MFCFSLWVWVLVAPKDEAAGVKVQPFVWRGRAFVTFIDGFAAVAAGVIPDSRDFYRIGVGSFKKG